MNTIRLPSGENRGARSNIASAGSVVRRRTLLPSASITWISNLPWWLRRSESNAICEPSGDHPASPLKDPESVSLTTPVPSGFILKMSLIPEMSVGPPEVSGSARSESRASLAPPGFHTAQPLLDGPLVSLCWLERSLLATQVCANPP